MRVVENDVTKLRKGFLAQSLVATVVNFGGIYFMMFLFQGNTIISLLHYTTCIAYAMCMHRSTFVLIINIS